MLCFEYYSYELDSDISEAQAEVGRPERPEPRRKEVLLTASKCAVKARVSHTVSVDMRAFCDGMTCRTTSALLAQRRLYKYPKVGL
jgi:hypothetical protein